MKSAIEMDEKETVHLVVTSPPYPMIEMWDEVFRKLECNNYDEMHEYLGKIWKKCFDALVNGGILCINIGDATRSVNDKFKIYPNHSRVIEICEKIKFETLPYILWKKPTNKPNAFLGSGFLPTNAYVTLDTEFILLFRKNGLRKFKPKDEVRYASKFTKEERDIWFSQTWAIKGERQNEEGFGKRTAAFPKEIPRRLIKMFSVIGDTVLDPFLGTGTTILVAKELNRNSMGYEIEKSLRSVIERKVGYNEQDKQTNIEIIE
jgi:site-specific DNA-methyltransferase (cytosine-N4-specific)